MAKISRSTVIAKWSHSKTSDKKASRDDLMNNHTGKETNNVSQQSREPNLLPTPHLSKRRVCEPCINPCPTGMQLAWWCNPISLFYCEVWMIPKKHSWTNKMYCAMWQNTAIRLDCTVQHIRTWHAIPSFTLQKWVWLVRPAMLTCTLRYVILLLLTQYQYVRWSWEASTSLHKQTTQ